MMSSPPQIIQRSNNAIDGIYNKLKYHLNLCTPMTSVSVVSDHGKNLFKNRLVENVPTIQ